MIYTFKSTEAGEMIVMKDLAEILLPILNKEITPAGVIMGDEVSDCIKKLQIFYEQNVSKSSNESAEDDEAEDSPKIRQNRLQARIWPFIEFLKYTEKAGKKAHITWNTN